MHRLPGLLLFISIVSILLAASGDAARGIASERPHRRVLDVFGFESREQVALDARPHGAPATDGAEYSL
jgi:hypothetical protein